MFMDYSIKQIAPFDLKRQPLWTLICLENTQNWLFLCLFPQFDCHLLVKSTRSLLIFMNYFMINNLEPFDFKRLPLWPLICTENTQNWQFMCLFHQFHCHLLVLSTTSTVFFPANIRNEAQQEKKKTAIYTFEITTVEILSLSFSSYP
jgi:hypothetical protein